MADSFYIGMDLCSDFTQLSYYNDITREPESVSQLNNKETYMMPNILFYSVSSKRWYVGGEASEARFSEQGVVIDGIFENLGSRTPVRVGNEEYSYNQLFLMMVKLHIDSFLYRYEDAVVKKLVISIPEYNSTIHSILSQLYKELDVPEECIEITSHLDSGLYYIFNQQHDLWINSVALYDYNADGLNYYRIDISRNRKPEIVSVTHDDYSEQMSLSIYGNDTYAMDNDFAKIAEYENKKAYISSVFLTGIGFSDKWMKKSTNVLCQGRRVFVGQNIYTKGACFRAVGGDYKKFYERFYVETKENVLYDVGIRTGNPVGEEKDDFVPITTGGKQWYNTRGHIEVILDDTDRIRLSYKSIRGGEEKQEVVKIHGIPKRPNKTTKLSIEAEFDSPSEGAVIIKDLGFGKLFPTTNKVYRKEFSLNDTPLPDEAEVEVEEDV
ncbi:MAG: hypothetical protein K6E28_10465 [Eubacterium sp.]|nr:hypothetical protein [Eubacterium sp.]